MKKGFDLVGASKWLSEHSRVWNENKGRWIAVGLKKNGFAVLSKGASLSAVMKRIGADNAESVLFTRVPKNPNAICLY